MTESHRGARSSVTSTSVRSTSPVLATDISKVATSPTTASCEFGDFVISMAGCTISTSASAVSMTGSKPKMWKPDTLIRLVKLLVTSSSEHS